MPPAVGMRALELTFISNLTHFAPSISPSVTRPFRPLSLSTALGLRGSAKAGHGGTLPGDEAQPTGRWGQRAGQRPGGEGLS